MVVPQALRVLRLQPGRKYCTVGRLSHEVGFLIIPCDETVDQSPSPLWNLKLHIITELNREEESYVVELSP
ncbi:hypothetical protein CH063_14643 [Colletotrichum higginsianum]|uniref:Uncharacterized protein n=1 Tax=Colletotrichum higginsianum (strain IMI 349063) TaxID=759273 RepID=H1VZF7_COLHI|nr:hypothetical protein CH063_14643 [Colletotrichum higginsianum]